VDCLRKDWIKLGVVELAASIATIVAASLFIHLEGVRSVLTGIGELFAIIGTILIVYGLVARDTSDSRHLQQRRCVYCGRRVESSSMICPRCGGKPSDGKRP
jgi:peptidoglycan/LPS O-acetylase OafA/YrhL